MHPDPDMSRPREVDRRLAPHAALLAGRRVLVTGAQGFIGRHLARHLLAAGADVHATARPGRAPRPGCPTGRSRVIWHEVDLTGSDAVERVFRDCAPEIVLHLASQVAGQREPELILPMLDNNGRAAVNVMRAAHRLGGCRVVLAGSIEEPHEAGQPPCSPYAAAKLAATSYALLFHAQWGLPVTVLRPSMVYGPDQPDERKLVPYVVVSMLEGREPQLSSGTRPVDWIYIDDVCDAFLAAATQDAAAGLIADIGSGVGTTVADTVRTIAALTGYEGFLGLGELDDRSHDNAHIADLAPVRRALRWRPETPLVAGLTETIRWYAAQRDIGGERRNTAAASAAPVRPAPYLAVLPEMD